MLECRGGCRGGDRGGGGVSPWESQRRSPPCFFLRRAPSDPLGPKPAACSTERTHHHTSGGSAHGQGELRPLSPGGWRRRTRGETPGSNIRVETGAEAADRLDLIALGRAFFFPLPGLSTGSLWRPRTLGRGSVNPRRRSPSKRQVEGAQMSNFEP